MTEPARLAILTVRVPLAVRKQRSGKVILTPADRHTLSQPAFRVDNSLVKAVARAFRWRQMIEMHVYATIEEIAASERINASYVSRILRLTLLRPRIVEEILDGRQPTAMTLAALLRSFPVEWNEQDREFGHNPTDLALTTL